MEIIWIAILLMISIDCLLILIGQNCFVNVTNLYIYMRNVSLYSNYKICYYFTTCFIDKLCTSGGCLNSLSIVYINRAIIVQTKCLLISVLLLFVTYLFNIQDLTCMFG